MKRLISILAIIITLISCGTKQTETITDSDSSTTTDTAISVVVKDTAVSAYKNFSYKEIIAKLPEQTTNLDYNEAYFDDYAGIQTAKAKMIGMPCGKDMLPDTIVCADSVFFCWKITGQNYTLIDLLTMDWNAKGPNVMHHLITVDNKSGKFIECMHEWAACYSVAVENPNGGTSAGIEYTKGGLDLNPVLTLSVTSWESNQAVFYELSTEGYFVSPYARFEAEKDLQ